MLLERIEKRGDTFTGLKARVWISRRRGSTCDMMIASVAMCPRREKEGEIFSNAG